MAVTDEQAAAAAIASLVKLTTAQQEAYSQVTAILASGDEDSIVDTEQFFSLYNTLYFDSKLLPRVELSWSPRLTLCAGLCELSRDAETKKFTRIRVKLSEPLLKLRPRSDLLNTLLHECIHAYLFVASNFGHVRDPTGGHGPGFQALAAAINAHGGYAITQFHSFHDEVDSYRTHVWLCNGACRTQPPHFGLVKRTMNRAPGKTDLWWAEHEKQCGGGFDKIAEPDLTKKQLDSLPALQRAGRQKNKIDLYVKEAKVADVSSGSTGSSTGVDIAGLESLKASRPMKRPRSPVQSKLSLAAAKATVIACPICDSAVKDIYINEHLDKMHSS